MNAVDFSKGTQAFDDGKDAIIVQKALTYLPNGAVLDVTAFTDEHIRAGHIIVRDASTKNLKPLAVSGANYQELGTDVAVGVAGYSVAKGKAFVSVITSGQINGGASKYKPTKALADALPRIEFTNVELA